MGKQVAHPTNFNSVLSEKKPPICFSNLFLLAIAGIGSAKTVLEQSRAGAYPPPDSALSQFY